MLHVLPGGDQQIDVVAISSIYPASSCVISLLAFSKTGFPHCTGAACLKLQGEVKTTGNSFIFSLRIAALQIVQTQPRSCLAQK